MAAKPSASAKTATPRTTGGRPAPSTKPLWQKLGVSADCAVWIAARPATVDRAALTGEARRVYDGLPARTIASPTDVLVAFVADRRAIAALAAALRGRLAGDPRIWIAYPKGGATDFNRDRGWDGIEGLGLRGVAQIAVDATWSALRFRRHDAVGTTR